MEYSEIINELNNNKIIIYNLINNIDQKIARYKPNTERRSILEIINHMIDIEVEDFRYILNITIHNPDEKWPSFNEQEWITSREYNKREINKSINNFLSEREKTIKWLNEFKNLDFNKAHSGNCLSNKEMKVGDILYSWIGHDLFHIKQITLLKWDILLKLSEPFSPAYSGFFT